MPTLIDSRCDNCLKTFKITLKEFNRHLKMGWTAKFCSKDCCKQFKKNNPQKYTSHLTPWTPDEARAIQHKALNAKKLLPKLMDAPFYEVIRRTKKRGHAPNNLTTDILEKIWEKQNGVCPYTGWKLELPIYGVKKHLKLRVLTELILAQDTPKIIFSLFLL